jgi:hypothetical protein
VSKETQCNIVQPPVNAPLSDAQTQATINLQQDENDDDVQIIDDKADRMPQPQYAPRSNYYIIQGIDDPCSNLYQFSFTFHRPSQHGQIESEFSSLEQCYKYYRVLPHDTALAEEILREDCPYKIMKIAKRCENRRTPEDIELMTEMVVAKAGQCRAFRDAMRAALAMDLKFLHSTYPADNVFGSGLHHSDEQIPLELPGQNILGKIVTTCANSLKPESEYNVKTSVEFVNGNAVILHDGEKLPTNCRKRQHKYIPPWKRPTNPIPPWKRHPRKDYPTWAGGVQFRQPRPRPQMQHICFHCSVPGHTIRDCRLRHVRIICRACNREGHKEKYCTFIGSIPNDRPIHTVPSGDQRQPDPQVLNVQKATQSRAGDTHATHKGVRDFSLRMPLLSPSFIRYPVGDTNVTANMPLYAYPPMLPTTHYYQNFPPLVPPNPQQNF